MIKEKTYEELIIYIKNECNNKINQDNLSLFNTTKISKEQMKHINKTFHESVFILNINCYEKVEYSNKDTKLDVMMKVLIQMFAELAINDKLSSNSERNLDDKKTMITCFEKAIKSIRYNLMTAEKLLEAFDDNLELLVEVSEVFDANQCFNECVDHFIKTFNKDYLVVIFNKMEE